MDYDQQKAMFAQMRQNAVELNQDHEGVFRQSEPQSNKKIILQRIFNHAEEMKEKDRKWREDQSKAESNNDENNDSKGDDTENNEYSFVTLEDGTSVRWTPEVKKALLKVQAKRFEKEAEKEYGLYKSEQDKIREKLENRKYEKELEEELGLNEEQLEELERKAEKRNTSSGSKNSLNRPEINPSFSSATAEILH